MNRPSLKREKEARKRIRESGMNEGSAIEKQSRLIN